MMHFGVHLLAAPEPACVADEPKSDFACQSRQPSDPPLPVVPADPADPMPLGTQSTKANAKAPLGPATSWDVRLTDHEIAP